MFKKAKDLTERSQSLLKNKDCRKLRQDILQQFPNLSDTQLSELIPNKCQILVIKLASKSILYLIDEIPYFFDNSGRNILYPTVFFIWRFPHTTKLISIHSPVSEFILNGADLMLPGICFVEEFLTMKKDEKVCICVHGNPLPFAIGNCLVNHEYIISNGLQGKAVEVLHQFGDVLWGMTPHINSNEGFTTKRIYPLNNLKDSNNNNMSEEEGHKNDIDISKRLQELQLTTEETITATSRCDTNVNPEVDMINEDKDKDNNKDESEDDVQIQIEDDSDSDDDCDGGDNLPENYNNTLPETETETEATKATAMLLPVNGHTSTTSTDKQTMDNRLLESLLLNLKYVIKDTLLPILVSTLWNMLLRSSAYPSQPSLDIKQSSYKKVSVFLKHTHQLGLVTLTEKAGVAAVTAVQRAHDLYRGIAVDCPEAFRAFVLHTTSAANESLGGTSTTATTTAAAGKTVGIAGEAQPPSKGSSNNRMRVVELYKLNKAAKELIGAVRGQYGECLTLAEVRVHLMEYIRKLSPPTVTPLLLSPESCDLTFNPPSPILTATSGGSTSSTPAVPRPPSLDQLAKDQVWLPFTDRLGTFLYGNEWSLGAFRVSPAASDSPLLPVPANVSKSSKKKGDSDSKPETASDCAVGRADKEGEYFDNNSIEEDVTHNVNNSYHSNASVVGGVIVSSISRTSNSGSSSSNTKSTSASKNNSYMGNSHSLSDFPTLSQSHQRTTGTTSTAAAAPTSSIRGSSSIGGWGVDKGQVWAPVSLSSAPTATATATALKKQKEDLNKKEQKAKAKAAVTSAAQTARSSPGPPAAPGPTPPSVAESVTSGQWIRKEDIIKSFLSKLSSAHVVINASGVSKVSNGKPPVVLVEVEKRMGNKLVTRVRGLAALGFDNDAIAKDCQKKFACSSTVSEVVGQSKGETELVVQGNFIDEIPDFLCGTYSIPKGLVVSKSSSGIPKKKKK